MLLAVIVSFLMSDFSSLTSYSTEHMNAFVIPWLFILYSFAEPGVSIFNASLEFNEGSSL